jgi:hypothetical protein
MHLHGVTTMPAIVSSGVIEHGLRLDQIWEMIRTYHTIQAANATGIVAAKVPPSLIAGEDWDFTGDTIADCYLLDRLEPGAEVPQHYLLLPTPLALPGLNLAGMAAQLSYGELPPITGDGEIPFLTENAWQMHAAYYMMNLLYEHS